MQLVVVMVRLALVLFCWSCISARRFQKPILQLSKKPSTRRLQANFEGDVTSRAFSSLLLAISPAIAINRAASTSKGVVDPLRSKQLLHNGPRLTACASIRSCPCRLVERDQARLFTPPLWLDLRGLPAANDMKALLELYGGVKKQFENSGISSPEGTAVAGILHDAADIDAGDSEVDLPMLVVGEDGSLRSTSDRIGHVLKASADSTPEQNEAVGKSISLQEQNIALFGKLEDIVHVLNFLMYLSLLWEEMGDLWEDQKKDILTTVLTEIRDSKGLSAVSKVARDYQGLVPFALLLRPDENLWYEALSQRPQDETTEQPIDTVELWQQKDTLDQTIYYASAVLTRNCRQLDSYVDEAAQWEDQDDVERYHILSKPHWEKRLNQVLCALHLSENTSQ